MKHQNNEFHILVWDDEQLGWIKDIYTVLHKIRGDWSIRFVKEDLCAALEDLCAEWSDLVDYSAGKDIEDRTIVFHVFHSRKVETVSRHDLESFCCALIDRKREKTHYAKDEQGLQLKKLTSVTNNTYGIDVVARNLIEFNKESTVIIASYNYTNYIECINDLVGSSGQIAAVLEKDDFLELHYVELVVQIIITAVLRWEKKYKMEMIEGGIRSAGLNPEDFITPLIDYKNITELTIGRSLTMQGYINNLVRVSKTNMSVLIRGESGVGKERVADLIFRIWKECIGSEDGEFVKVNCTAMPETLLESELFGHVKGAFTDAKTERDGKIKSAENGMLLLDEIGDMPLALQTKILRFVQEKTYMKLGSDTVEHANVRIIASTHQNLEELMRNNKFRPDLFYRINQFPLFVPSLNETPERIHPLIDALCHEVCMELIPPKNCVTITENVYKELENHHWQNNVRELRNVISFNMVMLDSTTWNNVLWPPHYDQQKTEPYKYVAELPYDPQLITRAKQLYDRMSLENNFGLKNAVDTESDKTNHDALCVLICALFYYNHKHIQTTKDKKRTTALEEKIKQICGPSHNSNQALKQITKKRIPVEFLDGRDQQQALEKIGELITEILNE